MLTLSLLTLPTLHTGSVYLTIYNRQICVFNVTYVFIV
jgi:hypothetical protein